jgi:putative hemolysin
MGEIPKEEVKYPPVLYDMYDFTILSVKDRRIEKVRIEIRERDRDRDSDKPGNGRSSGDKD